MNYHLDDRLTLDQCKFIDKHLTDYRIGGGESVNGSRMGYVAVRLEGNKSGLKYDTMTALHDKLEEHGYIAKWTPASEYHITNKGILFNLNSGYAKIFEEERQRTEREDADRKSQRDLTQSVKKTNRFQIASVVTTFLIIGATLAIAYYDYKLHQEELRLLQSNKKQELSAKLIQERFVAYQTKIDSLYRALDEREKQLQAK